MKKILEKNSIYKLEAYDSKNNLVCTSETRSTIRCERMIHKLETKGFAVVCFPFNSKIYILEKLRNPVNNIAKKFKTEKSKTEDDANEKLMYKKYQKLQELLKYLEGTKVPYFKVPAFLRSKNCFLKILSPVPSTVIDDGKEKRFILEYNLTNTLCDINQYELDFKQYGGWNKTTWYKKLTKEKELFKFLKNTKRKKQWDSFKNNPWALTLLGVFVGSVGEKLINFVIGIFYNNQYEIILHIIK